MTVVTECSETGSRNTGDALGATLVLAGTSKGLFTLRSDPGRERFELSGPQFPGEEIYSTCIDTRSGEPRLFAGSTSSHWGPVLRRSDDFGATWTEDEQASLSFPAGTDASLARIWQLAPGPLDQPEVVFAGVEPAALFRSDDGGRTFSLMQGLWDHPHRPQWEPGGGGLCLHTILIHPNDPDRLLIAISAAGVYLSDDGGGSWRASNSGIIAGFLPDDPEVEFGQCVHKVARDAADPERLYLQHHGGIYRSDSGGDSWQAMTGIAGMDFGFPVVAHPGRGGTAYLLPLESDGFRCTPNGQCTVWRTTDAGASWEPLTSGLPQRDAHLTILRDAFTTDGLEPAGLYFGTRSGELYGSIDDGDTWQMLAEHLPPVLSVRAAQVG